MSLYVKQLQSYRPSNFEDDLIATVPLYSSEWAEWQNLLQISNFDSLQLCSTLSYIYFHCVFGKI